LFEDPVQRFSQQVVMNKFFSRKKKYDVGMCCCFREKHKNR